MCKNEALANRVMASILSHGVDQYGVLDYEKTKAILVQSLMSLNPGAEDDEEDAL
jgi:hypothetical protein